MVKSRIEETEEEFDARMAAISAEAKNPDEPQDNPTMPLAASKTSSIVNHTTEPERPMFKPL